MMPKCVRPQCWDFGRVKSKRTSLGTVSRPPHRCYLILHLTAAAPIRSLLVRGRGRLLGLSHPLWRFIEQYYFKQLFKGRIKTSQEHPGSSLLPKLRSQQPHSTWRMPPHVAQNCILTRAFLPGLLHQPAPGARGLFRVSSLAPLDQVPKFKQDDGMYTGLVAPWDPRISPSMTEPLCTS